MTSYLMKTILGIERTTCNINMMCWGKWRSSCNTKHVNKSYIDCGRNQCLSEASCHVRKTSTWMQDHKVTRIDNDVIFFLDYDLTNFESGSKEEMWKKATDSEIESIRKNNTWELTYLSSG